MTAAVTAPIVALALDSAYAPMLLGFALLVLWQHRENILRLTKGTEPRVALRKSSGL
jgi:glycerol-3-phosphate acyltransferase PlsY